MAVGVPSFATAGARLRHGALGAGATAGPDLVADRTAPAWLVTQNASAAATERFWQALLDRATYGP